MTYGCLENHPSPDAQIEVEKLALMIDVLR
jgi:hypothetical protein